jgi:hypothetical protein
VTAPSLPLTLRLAIIAVLVETLMIWLYVAVLIYAGGGAAASWRIIVYFALYAFAFSGLAWALVGRRRWVRAPLIVLQLLLIAAGVAVVSSGAWLVGLAMIGWAAGCVVLLVLPPTRAALGIR